MATIPRPYTRQVQSFNPQRSAATGRPQALLEELAPAMRYRPQAPVSQMLYSAPPSAEQVPMVDYFGGGPGDMDSSGNATALAPNAPNLGFDPASAVAKGAIFGIPSLAQSLMADLALHAGKVVDAHAFNGQISGALTKGAHDVATALGFPSAFGMSQGAFGKGGASTDLGQIGTPESPLAPDMAPPPSDLADIGIGGGFGSAGDVGNAGFGGLGGIASF